MKRESLAAAILAVLVLLLVGSRLGSSAAPQVEKPKSDYMTTILSRNAEPLGLKENPVLRRYLSQSAVKWAVRSVERHILN